MRKLTTLFATFMIATAGYAAKSRLIVMTDIGGSDPDDQQSMVHLLSCLDRVDLEGIIYQHAWVSFNRGNETNTMGKILDTYNKVWHNLSVHASGIPSADYLRGITKHGQYNPAMAGVGEDKDSEGSELIIKAVDNKDPRPVWIAAWSGLSTLAQALWKVENTRDRKAVERFVSKVRVYDILGQDEAGAWITSHFPNLIYIRNKEVYGWPNADEWFKANIQSKGAWGGIYPDRVWATEGDSPSFLYVIDNGLNAPEHPDWGGWGGRFDLTRKAGIRGMDFVKENNLDESLYDDYYMMPASKEGCDAIRMWSEDIHNDFAARMVWSTTSSYSAANHHPIAIIGKDKTTKAIVRKVKAGKTISIDASRSYDPDGGTVSCHWLFYKEPSSYKGEVRLDKTRPRISVAIPHDAAGTTIHLVLRITDNGTPALASYRRVILECR